MNGVQEKYSLQDIEKLIHQLKKYTEKTSDEIIANYDFFVGSRECKYRLMEILPKGASIIYSPYIENPTMIYAMKKVDIEEMMDDESEEEDEQG